MPSPSTRANSSGEGRACFQCPLCVECTDSRRAAPDDLFFALAGERHDAHRFLAEVARRGAGAIVAERRKWPAESCPCPVIAVSDTRRALGQLAARYRRDFVLPVIAVGGSNGKTTTKDLIASVLRQSSASARKFRVR